MLDGNDKPMYEADIIFWVGIWLAYWLQVSFLQIFLKGSHSFIKHSFGSWQYIYGKHIYQYKYGNSSCALEWIHFVIMVILFWKNRVQMDKFQKFKYDSLYRKL